MNPLLRYQINYTIADRSPIVIPRSTIVDTAGDISFIGKNRVEYGEIFNTNILRLLERFAAPEDPDNPGNPYLESVMVPMLSRPVLGQIWFNKTQSQPFVWNGSEWLGVSPFNLVAGNSGVIFHGQQIPQPVDLEGNPYDYSECVWHVAPFGSIDTERIVYMACYTDSNGVVTMEYLRSGDTTPSTGYVNYQIMGIRGNSNNGEPGMPPDPPWMTPTPTPTQSVTMPPSATPTPTAAPTRTPGHTVTASVTPTVTRSPTPPPSATPSITASTTPTPTVTPTVTPSSVPTWILIDTTEEILPSSDSTGQPCEATPPPEECHIGVLGVEIDMISECYINSDEIKRITRKYVCNPQPDCSVT